jgi:Uma2 family endonuclease
MKIITNINQLDLNGSYNYADYLQWQFKERLELFKGKIFKMSPAPNRFHQLVLGNLHINVMNFFNQKECQVYLAPFDVRLVKQKTKDEKVVTVVQPDLCIVCDAEKLDDRGCNGAPDLVVEILSPGNTKKEMGIKFDLYEKNGVKEYWIIDPTEKNLFIYTAQNGKFIGLKPLTEDDKIKSPLFPNLNFPMAKIYGNF